MLFPVVFLVLLATPGQAACTLPSNQDELKIKVESSGNDWTATCKETNWVFVNSVRSVDSVDVTDLDTNDRIKGSCSTGSNVPDIFKYLGAEREVYCQPGCNTIHGDQWKVNYPEEVYSREIWSPPIRPVAKTVSVECATGYGRKVGDDGKSETSCTSNGWAVASDKLLTCQRGCKDITASVPYAETTAVASKVTGDPPFSTGDIVPFNCKSGYVLVGYATLTCDSMGNWNSKMPQCVVVSGTIVAQPTLLLLSLAILLKNIIV